MRISATPQEIMPLLDQLMRKQRLYQYLWTLVWLLCLGSLLAIVFFSIDDSQFMGYELPEWANWLLMGFFLVAILSFSWVSRHYFRFRSNSQRLFSLLVFFEQIRFDLHPSTRIKGDLDLELYRHLEPYRTKGRHSEDDPYPTKFYYKQCWAQLKLRLIDGSLLKLKCIDKIKEKKGNVQRVIHAKRGGLHFNPQIYKIQRRNYQWFLPESFDEPLNPVLLNADPTSGIIAYNGQVKLMNYSWAQAQQQGFILVQACKNTYKLLGLRGHSKNPTGRAQQAQDYNALRFGHFLQQSSLNLTRPEIRKGRAKLRYQGVVMDLKLDAHKGDEYLMIRVSLKHLSALQAEALLRANPELAHARFALYSSRSGEKKVMLVKCLLYATLDQQELDSALAELAQLAFRFRPGAAMPQRLRRFKGQRDEMREAELLKDMQARLEMQLETLENKYKLTLPLASGRQHKVHLRFDREDILGRQIVSCQSFFGARDFQRFQDYLHFNAEVGYGGVGLLKHGNEEQMVISEAHLVESLDPEELEAIIVRLVASGDKLERELSPVDQY